MKLLTISKKIHVHISVHRPSSAVITKITVLEVWYSLETEEIVTVQWKISKEKTFTNFAVLEPPTKFFSTKFGCAVPTYVRL